MESAPQNQTVRAQAGRNFDRPMEDIHFRLLRLLETRPDLSQRDLARELGTSLGKANYCLNALIDKGLVKVRNFRNNQNKLGYAYLLTPRGIDSKATIAVQFLKRKMAEYEMLKQEIEQLQRELGASGKTRGE
jgi:EPS-associated MarR family transcriptional regulator